jgi:hypothetical protein
MEYLYYLKVFDIRSDNGCIYCYPIKYFNRNKNDICGYEWKDNKSILDNEPSYMPKWLKDELVAKFAIKNKTKKTKEKIRDNEKKIDIRNIIIGYNIIIQKCLK